MNIAIKCGKCGQIFLRDNENDLMMEFDFLDQKIKFLCRNPKCGHDNQFDMGSWARNQKKSPLPNILTGGRS